jgi:AcrR family transcriptional regulator
VPTVETSHPRADQPLPRGSYAISAGVVAADQRRRLLEALPQAVAENGFEATTVDTIVKLAQVRRNAFYEQFGDKGECFAAAYEIAQERLLGVLTFQCYTRTGLAERVGSALEAGLDLLGTNPVLANLIVVEGPAAGAGTAARHHEWLDRYGRMMRLAAIGSVDVATPAPALEPAIVGGIVSRIKQLVLAGEAGELPRIHRELVEFALSFYGSPEYPLDSVETSSQADGAESAQPQSPARRSVLEPV